MSADHAASPGTAPGAHDAPGAPPADDAQTADAAAAAAASAATAAVSRGATPEETRQAVADAIGNLKLEISDTDADKIAERMIAKLEARGAFEDGATPAAPATAPAAAGTSPDAIADAAAAGVPNDGRAAHGGGVADPPPRKKSWAERFQRDR